MRQSPDITRKLIGLMPESGVILDIGCGDLSFLRMLCAKERTLLGTDITKPEEIPEGIDFECGRAEELPFENESADTILMQCVFSLCDAEKTVSEIRRVLKEDGTLVISDLYSRSGKCASCSGENLGRIEAKEQLESHFNGAFELRRFEDVSASLAEMLGQALMDGQPCVSCADLAVLKEIRAGYGIWVWQRREEGKA